MEVLVYLHKTLKRLFYLLHKPYCNAITWYLIKASGVQVGNNFSGNGVPIFDIALGGKMMIGNDFKMNNGDYYNRIGRQQKCFFVVGKDGEIIIGNNVGISSTAIICQRKIVIEDNVKIGGNVVIYDTDFHSLNNTHRLNSKIDYMNAKKQAVIIKKDAFIGAHCTILKGVVIGERSIIGACSVVTKSVPADEIWAGNPARKIK
jgi:acetyltransferase-like isoleucine patch superfamily enzyme